MYNQNVKLVIKGKNIPVNQTLIFKVMFFLLIFLLFFIPHADPDFGWHYRCGYELIHLHQPCINNSFSYFLSDYKWANPTFLYDALLSITFDIGGFLALSFLGTLILSLMIFIIFKIMKGDILIKASLLILSTYLAWTTISLGFRSQFITLLFIFIEIWLFLNKKWKLLPLLFLIWANSHAGFFMGPIIFVFYLLDSIYKWLTKQIEKKELISTLTLFLISTLATFINPFGYKIYLEIYHHMQIPMNTIIAEWVPPNPIQIFIIIALSTAYILKHISSNDYKKWNIFFVLLLILSTYLAITARRNLPIFYYIFALISSFEFRNFRFSEKVRKNLIDVLLLFMFAGMLSFGAPNIYSTFMDIQIKKPFLENQLSFFDGKSGNIYNTYEWGGFLIWKLPNMKIFVDGRMPAWIWENNESPYTTWLKITQTQLGWEQTLNKYHTDYLLIANGTFLDLLLKEHAKDYNYQEVQRDEQGVIYEHKDY